MKVNGHRMELGEIESNIETHASVRRAIVMARQVPPLVDTMTLVAYVEVESNLTPTGEGADHGWSGVVQAHVRKILPPYMVPKHVVMVQDWPLNTSNKVMRQQLPMPDTSRVSGATARRPAPSGGFVVDPEEVLEQVTAAVEQVAGIEATAETSMMSIGIDSVLAVVFTRYVFQATKPKPKSKPNPNPKPLNP